MQELEYPFDGGWIRRQVKKIKKELLLQENLIPKKIALLSGSTIGQLKQVLEVFLLNQGIQPTFYEGAYNNYYEEAVFATDALIDFAPDIVYIHTSVRNIKEWPIASDDKDTVDAKLQGEVDKMLSVWNSLEKKLHCPIIQNNFEMLPYRVMGNMDCVHITGRQYFLEALNHRLIEEVQRRKDVFLNDLHYEAASFGVDKWFDNSSWYAFKYAFSPDAIPLVAFNISNIIKSYYGKNKKAVALDLDNTLWKGVIGDDGVEGIELGIETPEGMMYGEFQAYLKELKERGVLLTVNSKNEEGAEKAGLSHPSSVLSPEDITLAVCNWKPKSENMKFISSKLNLTTDSFVFVDDNPAEREEVSANSNVAVLPIEDVSQMLCMLDHAGYFEVTNYSEEDRNRGNFYKENLEREQAETGDYIGYLKGLMMKGEFACVHADNIDRVTQLINKTNQFNLTGLRLSKAEVETYKEPYHISICGTLYDKYGNNGLISVILGKKNQSRELYINVWIMSCRVFKRQMEYAMFDELVAQCKDQGVEKIIGRYIPTNKNMPVRGLYEELGFTLRQKNEIEEIWEYMIPDNYEKKNVAIEVS